MHSAQIADLVIGVLFLISIAVGYYRGLIRTIAGIAAMVVSYLGAVLVANVGKEPFAKQFLLPMLQEHMTGVFSSETVQKAVLGTASGLSYSILFGVVFFVLHFILFRIVHSLKVIDHLPVIGWLDRMGGAILGFLWIFLLCFLVGKVFFGYVPSSIRKDWGFGKRAVERTVLVRAFSNALGEQGVDGKKIESD